MECRVNDVLRTIHIRLDALHRVVFRRRHLFERRSMDDVVHALHRILQALSIPYIADEVTHTTVVIRLLHLKLLEFVA